MDCPYFGSAPNSSVWRGVFPTQVCISHSVMSDFVTLWTVALLAPLSMGFSRAEFWSGLPFPSTVPYTARKQFNGYQLDALISLGSDSLSLEIASDSTG